MKGETHVSQNPNRPAIRALALGGAACLPLLAGVLAGASGCGPGTAATQAAVPAEGPEAESPATHGHAEDQANVIVHRHEADRLWVFAESADTLGSGGEFHIYLDHETHPEAPAAFSEFGLGPGGALPAHRHDKTEEISYFLEGEGVVQVFEDGAMREVPVTAGDVWWVPHGTWHGLRNTGSGPLELVFATIPNEKRGLLSFFRRVGAAPGETPTPLDPDQFARIAAEHDLILRPASVD